LEIIIYKEKDSFSQLFWLSSEHTYFELDRNRKAWEGRDWRSWRGVVMVMGRLVRNKTMQSFVKIINGTWPTDTIQYIFLG